MPVSLAKNCLPSALREAGKLLSWLSYRQTALFDESFVSEHRLIFGEQGCSLVHRTSYNIFITGEEDFLMNILCIGDAMIRGSQFKKACAEFSIQNNSIMVNDWEDDWDRLQHRRLVIEKQGPDAEPVLPMIQHADKQTEMLLVLFAPVSAEAMDALPHLRVIGAARAGMENVNIQAATERGILVHHIMGRNAHAVSDFTIGLLLAEARNIARAHTAIQQGRWRKTFVNSDIIPEISGKTLGLVGFGYIGQLVAQKLVGFNLDVLVYDPVSDEIVTEYHVRKVSKEELLNRRILCQCTRD